MAPLLRGSIALALAALAAAAPAQGRKRGSDNVPADDKLTAKDPAIVAIDKFIKKKVGKKAKTWRTTMPRPPELEFTADRDYFWHLETDCGMLTVQLFPQEAPRHVASTIYLARAGFYDGLLFPRVMTGFMAQGGSPNNDQTGNAGYTLDHEFAKNRLHDGPGVLSAANSGEPNSDGSQFFLTFVKADHLDGHHTVYGKVVDSPAAQATLEKMEARGNDGSVVPVPNPPKIVRTWITVAAKPAGDDPKAAGKPDKDGKVHTG